MKKSAPRRRFAVIRDAGALSIRDKKRRRELPLWSREKGNRHGFEWTATEARQLCDWLNERDAGYPRLPTLPRLNKAYWWGTAR